MIHGFKPAALCLLPLITFLSSSSRVIRAQTVTVGSPQTMLTPSQRTGVRLSLSFPDGNMGAFLYHDTNYVFAPDGATRNTQGATVHDLNNWLSGVSVIHTKTNIHRGGKGAFDHNYAGGGAVYYDTSSGILIGLYHGEYWYHGDGSVFYSGHGLAYSNDLGVTWHKLGEVVSPQAARSGNCHVEVGTGTLVAVGDYLYDYYTDKATGCSGHVQISVARALISAVIAAARAGTPFTSGAGTLFMKYTGGDTWNGDGVTDLAMPRNGGGAFTALTTGNTFFEPNVAYSSYLDQYVMTYANSFASLEIRFSSDGLTWGNPTTLVGGGGSPPNGIYYPTLLNTSGGDPETLGSTFYVYYVHPFGDWSQSNLKRVQVTLEYDLEPPTNLQATVQ
jgi:hypothetical protein